MARPSYNVQCIPLQLNTIQNCTQMYCTPEQCTLHNCTLHNCTLHNCTLHNCTLHNCTLHNCTLHNCTLHNCTLHNCTLYTVHDTLACTINYGLDHLRAALNWLEAGRYTIGHVTSHLHLYEGKAFYHLNELDSEALWDIASLCINLSPKTWKFSPPIFGQFCEKLIFCFSPLIPRITSSYKIFCKKTKIVSWAPVF